MAVDYDLVVLGGTQAGYEAASHAAHLGARVALVLHELAGPQSTLKTLGTLWATRFPHSVVAKSRQEYWQEALQRAALLAESLRSEAPQQLMVGGVDVIAERGQLVGKRPLKVATPSRQLTTRALLLATGSLPRLSGLPGLDSVPYKTPETLLEQEICPQSVAILGGNPMALALGQTLCRLGVAVTLVTPAATLLSQEDPDVSRWITAQLLAEGVRVHLEADGVRVATDDHKIAIQLPDVTVTVETLVSAVNPRPNLVGLNLENVLDSDRSLTVNSYLQTSHPRIYACGAVLGGYEMAAIARQEALIAVDNALFWNRRRIDYGAIPYDLPTQPEMARVGLTEPQARQRYSDADLLIGRQSLYDNPKAQWLESTVGFCKLIAHRNGQILGAHGVGPEAAEWVQTLALLMSQKTPWQAIAHYPTLPYSLSEILRQTTQQWERDRWQPGQWRRDWSENWFNWRRSR